MAEYTRATFKGGKHRIDGNIYVGCTFKNAVIEYAGGTPATFADCTFGGCSIGFADAAARTVQFIQDVNSTPGGAALLDGIFPVTVLPG